jgi:hypothetical protein
MSNDKYLQLIQIEISKIVDKLIELQPTQYKDGSGEERPCLATQMNGYNESLKILISALIDNQKIKNNGSKLEIKNPETEKQTFTKPKTLKDMWDSPELSDGVIFKKTPIYGAKLPIEE